jgi:serine/threonine protein kinase
VNAAERYELLGPIGAGTMCDVQRARDRKHGEIVALKTLQQLDPNTLYRLKQEFRTLSRYEHPNLVQYLEMGEAGRGVYVAMELVEGTDFLTFCRGPGPRPAARSETLGKTAARKRLLEISDDGAAMAWPPEPLKGGVPPDFLRLRSALAQLAEGLDTLHRSGRLHRDLKPSNVLVTHAGRLVILDFGLVAEIDQDYTEGTLIDGLAGSAAYMSPEQAVGSSLGAASDWYSLGVMLYEALTGVWPFEGQLYPLLLAKQRYVPTPPSILIPGTPSDLDTLCMRLLAREPIARPTGAEILAALRERRPISLARVGGVGPPRMRFREPQLGALVRSIQAAKAPRTSLVVVRGVDGSGRSLFLRELVKLVRRREHVLTLKARSSSFELVPFQVIDELVDNASRVLRRDQQGKAAELMSAEIRALGSLFPALGRVEELELPRAIRPPGREALEQAPHGLRILLRTLCESNLLLVAIDDAHQGDADSARMLGWALASDPKLPLLVVLATREGGEFTEILLDYATKYKVRTEWVELAELTDAQARVVASDSLGVDPSDPRVDAILEGGPRLPKLLVEACARAGAQVGSEVVLDDVVIAQVRGLPTRWRGLLELLAIEPQGMPIEILVAAGKLGPDSFDAITALRALRLVRSADSTGASLAVNGARLQEWVYGNSSPGDRRHRHAAFAETMEGAGVRPDESLVRHWVRAREPERAAVVAWRGAEPLVRAHDDLGALPLLERGLELGKWNPREKRTIAAALGGVHARLGHAMASGEAFRVALLQSGSHEKTLPFRLARGDQALLSGDREAGYGELDAVIADSGGLTAARGRGLLGRLLWRRAEEPKFEVVPEASQDPNRAARAEATWIAWTSGALIDRAGAQVHRENHRREALGLGDPALLSRAESQEALWELDAGLDPSPRLARAAALAEGIRSPRATAHLEEVNARISLLRGEWRDAAARAEGAERLVVFRGDPSVRDRLELAITRAAATWMAGEDPALPYLVAPFADPELDARSPVVLAFGWGAIGHLVALSSAVDPGPTLALAATLEGVPRAWATVAAIRLLVAAGDPTAALARAKAEWPALEKVDALGDSWLRIHAWLARAAAARAAEGAADLATAVEALRREKAAWVGAWSRRISTGESEDLPPRLGMVSEGSPLAAALFGAL